MTVLLKFNGVKIYLFLRSLTQYLFPVKMTGKPNVCPDNGHFGHTLSVDILRVHAVRVNHNGLCRHV